MICSYSDAEVIPFSETGWLRILDDFPNDEFLDWGDEEWKAYEEKRFDDIPDFTAPVIHQGQYYLDMNSCGYCSKELVKKQLLEKSHTNMFGTLFEHIVEIKICTNCGWWIMHRSFADDGMTTCTYEHSVTVGNAKNFNVSALDVPIALLRKYLTRNPKDLAHIHPQRFELLMQDCLRDAYDSSEVIHMGYSKDGGIDLKLVLTNSETYLVQIKRRSDLTKNEGVTVVRELNGVLFREDEAKGMIITTAPDYTKAAKEERNIKNLKMRERYQVDLLKFDDVVKMINLPTVQPYSPWINHLEDEFWKRYFGGLSAKDLQ